MKLLSVMAAVRLDESPDSIENTLSLALVDPKSGAAANRSISGDPLASSSWEEVGHCWFYAYIMIYGIGVSFTELR